MMNFIYFIIAMSVLVIIHEFGHYIACKMFNVYTSEFAVGMGPKLFGKKFKETEFTIRAIPLGGFVAIAGDSENALESKIGVDVPLERTMKGISNWKNLVIELAGVTMNFLFAIIVVAGILTYTGTYALDMKPIVKDVLENSPAQIAGLQADDYIVKVEFEDGRVINPKSFEDIMTFTSGYSDEITYTVKRNDSLKSFTMKPELDEKTQYYTSGILLPDVEVANVTIFNSIYYSCDYLISLTKNTLISLGHMITGKGLEQMSGPVGIFQVTAQAASMGLLTYINFLALLSLNLGIFNLIPLPILDGGRVVITLIEMIIRKPVNEKFQNVIMSISMILLLALMLFVTFKDLIRLF